MDIFLKNFWKKIPIIFKGNSLCGFLYLFPLGIPPDFTSGDSSDSFRGILWRFRQGFTLRVTPDVSSGDSSRDSSRYSLWEFLQMFPLEIPPEDPSGDSSRGFLWRFFQRCSSRDSSRGNLWGFLQRFPQGIFSRIPSVFPLGIPPELPTGNFCRGYLWGFLRGFL